MSENEKKEIGKTEQNRPNREKTRKMLTIYALVFVGVVLPFFVFSCRNKDLGMTPQVPVQPVQQIPVQNPESDQL